MSKFTVCPQCRQSLPFPMDACTLCGYRSSRVTPGRVGIGIASACGCVALFLVFTIGIGLYGAFRENGPTIVNHRIDSRTGREVIEPYHTDQFFAIGPQTMKAFRSVRLGEDEQEVRSSLGQPFTGATYAFSDGNLTVGIQNGRVTFVSATGPYKDAKAYPHIQSEYARRAGRPTRLPDGSLAPNSP